MVVVTRSLTPVDDLHIYIYILALSSKIWSAL